MKTTALDPRLVGPLLLGLLAFGVHETAAGPAAGTRAAAQSSPASITLPVPLAWRGPAEGTRMLLDPSASLVRFRCDTGFGTVTADCADPEGSLTFAAGGQPQSLELRFELRRLRTDDPDDDDAAKALLGVASGDSITYHGTPLALETFAQRGVVRVTFDGVLGFGPHCRQQRVQLWLTMLLPGTVRLQGIGTIDGHDFGLPHRRRIGLFPERSSIAVALDVAFRRPPS